MEAPAPPDTQQIRDEIQQKKNCILTAAGDRSRIQEEGGRRQEAGEETKVINRREDGEADAGDRAGTGDEVRTRDRGRNRR